MYRKKLVLVVIVGICMAGSLNAVLEKVPVRIATVNGAVNNTFSVIQTTVYKDTNKNVQAGEEKPTVVRGQLDMIGPNRQSSKILDIKLLTPKPPTQFQTYGATQVLGKIGDLVGVVGGPKAKTAGAAIAGTAALIDYGQVIAEEEMNKLYENQDFRIEAGELVPNRYYRINTSTNAVEPTDDFMNDIKNYNDKKTQYVNAFTAYRKVESQYSQWYNKLLAADPAGTKPEFAANWQQLKQYNIDTVRPLLLAKNQQETEFAKMYIPFRIAVMDSPAVPGNTCGSYGNGPWELHIIFYLGARQTNQFSVRYCVPDNKKAQVFGIEIVENTIQQIDPVNKIQKFLSGGIRLYARDNINFAQATGLTTGSYGASKTEIFSFFSEMVSNPDAGKGIEDFLVAFRTADAIKEAQEREKQRIDEKIAKPISEMDEVVKKAGEAKVAWDQAEAQRKAESEAAAREHQSAAQDLPHYVPAVPELPSVPHHQEEEQEGETGLHETIPPHSTSEEIAITPSGRQAIADIATEYATSTLAEKTSNPAKRRAIERFGDVTRSRIGLSPSERARVYQESNEQRREGQERTGGQEKTK